MIGIKLSTATSIYPPLANCIKFNNYNTKNFYPQMNAIIHNRLNLYQNNIFDTKIGI